jgi:protein involved in ribonucleotide reduction
LSLPIDLVYFSNRSENTKRFVDKLSDVSWRIPLVWDSENPYLHSREFVLVLPTYGAGRGSHVIPSQVKKFLNVRSNREMLRGVIGTGNTNFGAHFCKAAEMISAKTGVPLIGKIEIFGTEDDVKTIKERLRLLYDYEL